MVGKLLCVRELLNVLAVKGEQGELGSGWCSGSCASSTCLGCWISGVPSMFWAVFVDGDGVLGCAVHVLGGFCGRGWCFEAGFEAGFGAGFLGMFGGGAILKNRGVGFVGDCCYICVIYILAVVCRLVIVANKKKLKTYDIQQKHSDCAYGSARGDGLLRTGKGHRLFPEQSSGSA